MNGPRNDGTDFRQIWEDFAFAIFLRHLLTKVRTFWDQAKYILNFYESYFNITYILKTLSEGFWSAWHLKTLTD